MKSKILILFLFFTASSCEDYLQEIPETEFSSGNFYTSEEGLTAGVLGVYDQLREFYDVQTSSAMFLGTDEGSTKFNGGFRQEFDNYTWNIESGYITDMWIDHYRIIMYANTLIIDAPNSGVNEEFVQGIISEAKFLRALAYFRLVQLWGPVPILMGGEVEEMPRAPVGEVYELILQDLLFATAEGNLPVEKNPSQPGRVTHYAAKSLLGKVYLTMASYKKYGSVFEGLMNSAGKPSYGYEASVTESANSLYQKAENVLKDVIDNGGYSLLNNYEDIFVIENKNFNSESIFEVQFSNDVPSDWSKDLGYPTWVPGNSAFSSWAGGTNSRATPSLYLFYDEGDQRRDYNMPPNYIRRTPQVYLELIDRGESPDNYIRIIEGTSNAYFRSVGFGKYRWGPTWDSDHSYPGGRFTPTNGIMQRYADVLLMYSEASLEANNGPTPEGLEAINKVRQRARGMNVDPIETPEFPDLTASDLTLDEIMDERVRELCIEHYRKFDLLRTNKLQAAIHTRRPIDDRFMTGPIDIADHRWLYPIPQREIDIVVDKEMLWQNPGY